jgi:hypothetical protein
MVTDILALLAPYAVLAAGEALVMYAQRKRRRRQAVKPSPAGSARSSTVATGWQQPTVKLTLPAYRTAAVTSPIQTTVCGTVADRTTR